MFDLYHYEKPRAQESTIMENVRRAAIYLLYSALKYAYLMKMMMMMISILS